MSASDRELVKDLWKILCSFCRHLNSCYRENYQCPAFVFALKIAMLCLMDVEFDYAELE
ncbi:MAG: hypothetical protein QXE92_02600 [Thermofilaceae archaeon]